jgi:homoserine kinase
VLGLALNRYVYANDEGDGDLCWHDHIARIAFEMAGGTGDIWFRFDVPPGRGMGFSAAARAAGAALAYAQKGWDADRLQRDAYTIVERLEGHGDNAAPAAFGGIQVIIDSDHHRLATDLPGELMLWVPRESSTSTDENRAGMSSTVDRSDAVYNLGRLGLLVASLYENDVSLLSRATEDRLHQPNRFIQQPASKAAYDAARAAGAAAWLSGSGPSVAIVVAPGGASDVAARLPSVGDVLHVDPDLKGTVVHRGPHSD